MPGQPLTKTADLAAFDHRNTDWYIDKLVQVLAGDAGRHSVFTGRSDLCRRICQRQDP
jgi:hypothetical protein